MHYSIYAYLHTIIETTVDDTNIWRDYSTANYNDGEDT